MPRIGFKMAYAMVRTAGYHDDRKTATRLCIEAAISRANVEKAFAEGQRARANGVRCGCWECNQRTEGN